MYRPKREQGSLFTATTLLPEEKPRTSLMGHVMAESAVLRQDDRCLELLGEVDPGRVHQSDREGQEEHGGPELRSLTVVLAQIVPAIAVQRLETDTPDDERKRL